LAVAITASGTARDNTEIRNLIRRISLANLYGVRPASGELLKLGIGVSQAKVGRQVPWRPKVPSPTWRSFLQNDLTDIVAIDMFVVATSTLRLLYVFFSTFLSSSATTGVRGRGDA
jgi:hypothetical protein